MKSTCARLIKYIGKVPLKDLPPRYQKAVEQVSSVMEKKYPKVTKAKIQQVTKGCFENLTLYLTPI